MFEKVWISLEVNVVDFEKKLKDVIMKIVEFVEREVDLKVFVD